MRVCSVLILALLIFPQLNAIPAVFNSTGCGIVSADGNVVFAHTPHKIMWYNITGSKIAEYDFENISRLSLSGDGSYVVVVSSEGGDYWKSMIEANVSLFSLNAGLLWSVKDKVRDVAISPEGGYVAVLSVEEVPYTLQSTLTPEPIGYNPVLKFFTRGGDLLWNYSLNMPVEWFSRRSGILDISEGGKYIAFGIPGRVGIPARVYLLNKNGSLLWERDVKGEPFSVRITRHGDKVYVLTMGGMLNCFSNRGEPLWEREIFLGGTMEASLYSSETGNLVLAVSFGGDEAYGSSRFDAIALNGDGNILLKERFSRETSLPKRGAVAGKYFAVHYPFAKHGELALYDNSGREVWRMNVSNFASEISISEDGDYISLCTQDSFIVFNNTIVKLDNVHDNVHKKCSFRKYVLAAIAAIFVAGLIYIYRLKK